MYDSRKTCFADFTISSPLTVISFASPRPKPIKYNILGKSRDSTCEGLKIYHAGESLVIAEFHALTNVITGHGFR